VIEFVLKLAEIPIRVFANYESTMLHCGAYLTEEAPVLSVSVLPEDLQKERRIAEAEAQRSGSIAGAYSEVFLEQSALYRKICDALSDYDILLFHGAAISVNGQGIIFTAPSGTGKTTHIRLWQQMFTEKNQEMTIINGDKPLIRFSSEGPVIFGTPWCGKEHLGENIFAPLKAMVQLQRGASNSIERIPMSSMLGTLLAQSYAGEGQGGVLKNLSLFHRMAKRVDCFSLSCTPELSAAETAYAAIFGDSFSRCI